MEEESWSKIPFQHYLNGTISQNPKRENHPVEEGSSTGKLVFFGNSDKTRSLANWYACCILLHKFKLLYFNEMHFSK